MGDSLQLRRIRFPRLATNYALLSGAEFISKVLGAIAFAYLARVLGPQSYGYLEFIIAIIFFFTLVVDSGLGSYGAREIAKDTSGYDRLTTHITLARFFLACVAFVILTLITISFNQPQEIKLLLFLYSLTLFALPTLAQWVFQGQDMMSYVALASIIRWTTFSVGVLVFVQSSDQLLNIPVIEGLAILLTGFFLFGALVFNFGIPRYRIDLGQTISIFRQAFPIGASELVWAIKVYFGTILLGLVIGGSELGWYSAANRIVISLHAFVWLYFYNLLPSISRTSQEPIDALQRLMRISIQITAWAAIFLGVIGTAFASTGIEILYGPQYEEATAAFRVLVWLIPLALLSGNFRYTLIGYSKQTLEFVSAFIGAVISIILNLILVRFYGFVGAAWALVISEAVIWAVAYYFVRRTITPILLIPYLQWPVIAGLVLIGTLYVLFPLSIWIAGSIAVIVYILVMFATQPNLFNSLRTLYMRD
jgi:O-antigen/teichoic acid export membrane protein